MEWFQKLKQRESDYLIKVVSDTFANVAFQSPEDIASIAKIIVPILLNSTTLQDAQQAILAQYTESQELAIKNFHKVRAERIAAEVGQKLRSSQMMPGATVLDIGCGNGIVAAHLNNQGYQVTCADIDDYRAEVAKTLPFIQINAGQDDYALVKGQWDASLLLYVLHHMPEKEQEILLHQIFHSDIHNLLIYEDAHDNQDYHADIDGISNIFLQTKDMDSFVVPMPCSYKSTQQWKNLFELINPDGNLLKLQRQGKPSSGQKEINHYFVLSC